MVCRNGDYLREKEKVLVFTWEKKRKLTEEQIRWKACASLVARIQMLKGSQRIIKLFELEILDYKSPQQSPKVNG